MRGGVSEEEVFGPAGYHADPDAPRVVVLENRVVNVREREGLVIEAEEREDGVRAELVVREGVRLEEPVHFCVGVPWEEGVQRIKTRVVVESGARVTLLSHCSFPRAEDVLHEMVAEFVVEDGAELEVRDVHYHGERGVRLRAEYELEVGEGGRLSSEFRLTRGRVGELEWVSRGVVRREGSLESVVRVMARGEDVVDVEESVRLVGEDAGAVLDSRSAAIDGARVRFVGEISGEAPGARGHVECSEIIRGDGRVESVPKLRVVDPDARLTHEAALGTLERREIEALMSRGLSEEEAVELLVEAMLRG